MAQPISPRKPSSRTSKALGLTLVEVLIAAAVSSLILAVSYSLTLSNKSLLDTNQARTETNQNIRGILDIITDDVRISGERMAGSPPVLMPIEISTNGDLILRRNLNDSVMSVCFGNVPIGSTTIDVSEKVSEEGKAVNCAHTTVFPAQQAWQRYRIANGDSVPVYIHQPNLDNPFGASGHGEFLTYTAENLPLNATNTNGDVPDNNDREITFLTPTQKAYGSGRINNTGDWRHHLPNFAGTLPSIYILEEHRYSLNANGTLELFVNGNTENPRAIAENVTNFTVQAITQQDDGTEQILTQFNVPNQWTNLKAIEITVAKESRNGGRTAERQVSARVYPRNHQSQ